jgi:hypothetical protein
MLLRQPYTLMEEEEEDVLINEGESESGWTGIGAKRLSGRRGFMWFFCLALVQDKKISHR